MSDVDNQSDISLLSFIQQRRQSKDELSKSSGSLHRYFSSIEEVRKTNDSPTLDVFNSPKFSHDVRRTDAHCSSSDEEVQKMHHKPSYAGLSVDEFLLNVRSSFEPIDDEPSSTRPPDVTSLAEASRKGLFVDDKSKFEVEESVRQMWNKNNHSRPQKSNRGLKEHRWKSHKEQVREQAEMRRRFSSRGNEEVVRESYEDFLKLVMQTDQSKSSEYVVCPDCSHANRVGINWCLNCGCVLIGVEPTVNKEQIRERNPYGIEDEEVERIASQNNDEENKQVVDDQDPRFDLEWDYRYTISPTPRNQQEEKPQVNGSGVAPMGGCEDNNNNRYNSSEELGKSEEVSDELSIIHRIKELCTRLSTDETILRELASSPAVERIDEAVKETEFHKDTDDKDMQTDAAIIDDTNTTEDCSLEKPKSFSSIGCGTAEPKPPPQTPQNQSSLLWQPPKKDRSNGLLLNTILTETQPEDAKKKPRRKPARHSVDLNDSYQRRWATSATTWNSYSYGEIRPKSSIPINKSMKNEKLIGKSVSTDLSIDLPNSSSSAFTKRFHRRNDAMEPLSERSEVIYSRYKTLTPRLEEGDISVWQCLPDEMLLHIFQFLPKSDLREAAATCNFFHRVSQDSSLWRRIEIIGAQITERCVEEIGAHHPQTVRFDCCKTNLSKETWTTFFNDVSESLRVLETPHLIGCRADILLQMATLRCKKLHSFDINGCKFKTSFLTQLIADFKQLRSVSVTPVTDHFVQKLVKQHSNTLMELHLGGSITEVSTLVIGKHVGDQLTSLSLSGCYKITNSAVSHLLARCNNLEHLNFSKCRQVRDSTIAQVAFNCHRLKSIVLSQCSHVTDASVVELGNLTRLTSITLDNTSITDVSVQVLAKRCDRLCELNVSETRVTEASLEALSRFSSSTLTKLTIDYCRGIPEVALFALLRSCQGMRYLQCYQCGFRVDERRIAKINPGVTVKGGRLIAEGDLSRISQEITSS